MHPCSIRKTLAYVAHMLAIFSASALFIPSRRYSFGKPSLPYTDWPPKVVLTHRADTNDGRHNPPIAATVRTVYHKGVNCQFDHLSIDSHRLISDTDHMAILLCPLTATPNRRTWTSEIHGNLLCSYAAIAFACGRRIGSCAVKPEGVRSTSAEVSCDGLPLSALGVIWQINRRSLPSFLSGSPSPQQPWPAPLLRSPMSNFCGYICFR